MKLDIKSFFLGILTGGAVMLFVCIVLLLIAAWLINRRAQVANNGSAPTFCPMAGDTNVTQLLKPIRQKFNMPAMAAAVVTSDSIKFVGAVGVRKRGTEVPVTLDDLWHLGSDGKIMTSTLIAKLVERGQLHWDTTLGDVFPEYSSRMHPDFQKVTLLQLLSHHAGLPANLDLEKYGGDDGPQLRLRAVQNELAKAPESKPGSTYSYSNLGYIIAAAVVEKTTGKAWEQIISDEVFRPLQMNSAGFGGSGTPGKIDQPWPHTEDGAPVTENGPAASTAPFKIGPDSFRTSCAVRAANRPCSKPSPIRNCKHSRSEANTRWVGLLCHAPGAAEKY